MNENREWWHNTQDLYLAVDQYLQGRLDKDELAALTDYIDRLLDNNPPYVAGYEDIKKDADAGHIKNKINWMSLHKKNFKKWEIDFNNRPKRDFK